ncbi:MAG: hydrogenase nickel incorporation protein HypB [Anaerolineales bacterium]|nr:hydrogenase nickel incorporation protein HypB [Anaerolineales bacterium]
MSQRVTVVENILNANDQIAEQNMAQLEASGVTAVNLMASPGAGKTSLILSTVDRLARRLRLGVVEGDTAPVTIDSERVLAKGVPAVQINTGGGCHLDAVMLQSALTQLDLDQLDLLIVENVGNLVCPANFRLGAQRNVLIASVPEGDDKPYKYPGMYRGVDALVINKIDLLPYTPFDMDYFCRGVEMLNPGLATFPLSCRTGEGLDDWIDWLVEQVRARRRV